MIKPLDLSVGSEGLRKSHCLSALFDDGNEGRYFEFLGGSVSVVKSADRVTVDVMAVVILCCRRVFLKMEIVEVIISHIISSVKNNDGQEGRVLWVPDKPSRVSTLTSLCLWPLG